MTKKKTEQFKAPSWNKTLDHFIKVLDVDKKESLNIHSILEKKSQFQAEIEFKSAKKEIEIPPLSKHWDPSSDFDDSVPEHIYIEEGESGVFVNKKQFLNKAKYLYGNYYDYSTVAIKSETKDSKKITIGCPEHGLFSRTIGAHMSGKHCPDCEYMPGSIFFLTEMVKKELKELAKNNKKFKFILINDANNHFGLSQLGSYKTTNLLFQKRMLSETQGHPLMVDINLYQHIGEILEEDGYLFIAEHTYRHKGWRSQYLESDLVDERHVKSLNDQQCSLNAVVRFWHTVLSSKEWHVDNLYIFKKSKNEKIFIAEKSWFDSSKDEPLFYSELNTLADNLVGKTNSGKIEEGLVKAQKEFKGIPWLKAEIKAENLKSSIKGHKKFSLGQLILEENKIKTNGETRIEIEPKENSLYFTKYKGRLQRLSVIDDKYLFIPFTAEEAGLTPPEYVLELKLIKTVLLAKYFPVYLSHEIAKDFGELLNFKNFKNMPIYLIPLKEQPKYIDNQKKLQKKGQELSVVMDGIVKIYSNEPSKGSWAIEKMDEMISAGEELSENEKRAKFIKNEVKKANERERMEFKYSFLCDYNMNNKNSTVPLLPEKALKDNVLKAINAMLNTMGGKVVVGVLDRETIKKCGFNEHAKKVLTQKERDQEKALYTVGIEPDLEKMNKVKYRDLLTRSINENFQTRFTISEYIKANFVDVDGLTCFYIEIKSYYLDQDRKKIVTWKDNRYDPLHRVGDSSLPLKGHDLVEHLNN